MAAVALYALPSGGHHRFVEALRSANWYVNPYLLMTSQWQQWNLFSPDPLRRVMTYVIDADRGGQWERVATIGPGSFSTWRYAAAFKYLGRTLEGDSKQLPLVERFLRLQCEEHALASGTHLRLSYHWYILPIPDHVLSIAEWQNFTPQWSEFVGSEILCGWPSGSGILRALPSR